MEQQQTKNIDQFKENLWSSNNAGHQKREIGMVGY